MDLKVCVYLEWDLVCSRFQAKCQSVLELISIMIWQNSTMKLISNHPIDNYRGVQAFKVVSQGHVESLTRGLHEIPTCSLN